ncbi:hypothetical protein PAESOLCIP111_03954 [Paenibacillus solanacearum]|uniref:Uncharacterized protein n=1 Tax=Paenibacillus solanacearum TaxID=2048548 RepID=A0A916K6C6_9BACL|nr:hypothetical protein [Paenibacillus solanacearum]CAG7638563.1 hypothetical protein PAESOLCIP111_03954 [Paenibacillus solanacearum]
MKTAKTKWIALLMGLSLMVPTAAGAAPESSTTNVIDESPWASLAVGQTNVDGVTVPGVYLVTSESKVAFIPNGVGLVVINKEIALPFGAYYVN